MLAVQQNKSLTWRNLPFGLRWDKSASLWSNPATWGGRTPAAGEDVLIPAGKRILLDVCPPPLRSLTIDGTLVFDEQDLNLTANWILVRGQLRIGAPNWPHSHKAVITLTGTGGEAGLPDIGSKCLVVAPGGTLDLHAEWRVTWAKLDISVEPGATQLLLDQPVSWRPGDQIVIGASEDPFEAEDRFVRSVHGNLVTLSRPLLYRHGGVVETHGQVTVDGRADVALLTRPIVIRGANRLGSDFGGFLYCQPGSKVRLDGVEGTGLGQRRLPSRYPVHLYAAGGPGQVYIRNSSLHHNVRQGLIVHRATHAVVQNNLLYDRVGQLFTLESAGAAPTGQPRSLHLFARTWPLSADEPAPLTDARPWPALAPALV